MIREVNFGAPRGIMQPSRHAPAATPKSAQDEVAYWMDRKEDAERQLAKALNHAEKVATARIAHLEDEVQRYQAEQEKPCQCMVCKLRRRFSPPEMASR